jgi:hypothetical protein
VTVLACVLLQSATAAAACRCLLLLQAFLVPWLATK